MGTAARRALYASTCIAERSRLLLSVRALACLLSTFSSTTEDCPLVGAGGEGLTRFVPLSVAPSFAAAAAGLAGPLKGRRGAPVKLRLLAA